MAAPIRSAGSLTRLSMIPIFSGSGRRDRFSEQDHFMKEGCPLGPFAIRHHTAANAGQDTEGDFRKLQHGLFNRNNAMAPNGDLQATAHGQAVESRNHGFIHLIHVALNFRTIPGILNGCLLISQHGGKLADIGTGGESDIAESGNDEPFYAQDLFHWISAPGIFRP